MGVPVDGGQPGLVHLRVTLGGGKRGMAQQFLNGAQIAAAGKQMGGEGMAQRVRRRRRRQAEQRPQFSHLALDDAGIEPLAALADKQRPVFGYRIRADVPICL